MAAFDSLPECDFHIPAKARPETGGLFPTAHVRHMIGPP
ncbi:hypothetical protein GXY_02286 [Novacetimonas hansenii ATCC 23769]|uniref:Uncharacterized protein n=1 Tax=Novacetimonas hansenii ATCC 23769 TaxID=714995 RepID=D5QBG4_NOVHA|nr:hypothetical protein GXY_02286 [Novacetimonas hansenii ATCC 23769]